MVSEKNSKRLSAVLLITLLLLCLPLFIGAIWSLLQPIEVWLFIGALVVWGLSIDVLFESNEDIFTRFVCLLLVIGLPLGFYFVMSNAS